MDIFVYCSSSNKVEENVRLEILPAMLADADNFVWVDLEAPTPDEEQRILADVFHFHPLTIEDARSDHTQPKIEEFPDYLYLLFHGVRSTANSRNFDTKELDSFLGKNFLVTYHHDQFRSIDNVKRQIRASPVACQRGSAYVLHQILDQMIDHYVPVIEDFDIYITDLEDRIFSLRRADNEILAEIIQLKRGVLRLRRVSQKQFDILKRLSSGEFSQIDERLLPFYRDVFDHLQRASEMSESYRYLADGLMNTYLSVMSNRLNEVMKTLTVFSAIMLPLTFITGFYGMNFDNLPEMHSPFGYVIAIGLMILTSVLMFVYFWRKGWIGGDAKGKQKPYKAIVSDEQKPDETLAPSESFDQPKVAAQKTTATLN